MACRVPAEGGLDDNEDALSLAVELEAVRNVIGSRVRAIDEARLVFPDDHNKLAAVSEIAERDSSTGDLRIRMLLQIYHVYARDDKLFDRLARTARDLSISAFEGLLRALPDFDFNPDAIHILIDVSASSHRNGLHHFLRARSLYGSDVERMRIVADLFWDSGPKVLQALSRLAPVFTDSTKKLKNQKKLTARFGAANYSIYVRLINSGVITADNSSIFDEYLERFEKFPFNVEVITKLLLISDPERRAEYLAGLESVRRNMISDTQITDEEREMCEFPWLVKTVFPKGNYSSHEANAAKCKDKSNIVARYEFEQDGYPAQFSAIEGYELREGDEEDIELLYDYHGRMRKIERFVKARSADAATLKADFVRKVDSLFDQEANPAFKLISGLSLRAKMLCLFLSELFRRRNNRKYVLKPEILDLIVEFKYVYVENFEEYVRQSADEVRSAGEDINVRRASWIQLATIYGENLKHVVRHELFGNDSSDQGHKSVFDCYSKLCGENEEKSQLSGKQESQFRSIFENDRITDKQNAVTAKARRVFGNNIDFEDEQELLAFNDELSGILSPLEGGCTFEGFIRLVPDLFELRKRYLFNVERELTKLFSRDISTINAELSKYKEVLVEEDGVVKSPKTRRVRSYFMKSKETANARMGAHLCIAGDHTMWTNRNYFELVTKDEDTDECVSVVMLLDIKTKSGKRYLWFGPNPFNSFMDKVPVKACYDYLYGVVTDFAAQNGFDGVVVPDERRIVGECTNREGEFPECIKRSMLRDDNGRLKWVDFENTHMLSRGQYKYGYEDGILIWERGL